MADKKFIYQGKVIDLDKIRTISVDYSVNDDKYFVLGVPYSLTLRFGDRYQWYDIDVEEHEKSKPTFTILGSSLMCLVCVKHAKAFAAKFDKTTFLTEVIEEICATELKWLRYLKKHNKFAAPQQIMLDSILSGW